MSEYSHCSICGGSFVGIGNVCPGCEDALSREPLEIRPIERKTWRTDAFSASIRRELATVKISSPHRETWPRKPKSRSLEGGADAHGVA